MGYGSTPYKIRASDINDIVFELNRIFALISDRLDRMEGFSGTVKLYDNVKVNGDLIIDSSVKGFILKDNQNPAHYWRVTMDSTGLFNFDDLGLSFS